MAETLRNPSTLASAISVVRSDDRRHARAAESAPRSAALTSSRQTLGDPRPRRRLPFECIALLLQGGGALGAYQAEVYEALTEPDLQPDWIAGISIGAINGALIADNAPAERVNKLGAFRERVTNSEGHARCSRRVHVTGQPTNLARRRAPDRNGNPDEYAPLSMPSDQP